MQPYKYQSEESQKLVAAYQESTNVYYVNIERVFLVPRLQGILRRRLNAQGKHEALNVIKNVPIKRVAQGDFLKFALLYGGVRETSKIALI